MMRLRSYWLALLGSMAVMPTSRLCCFTGVAAGAWSLMVPASSDVGAAFH